MGLFERLSPIRHVTSAYPPALLLHGDADTDVPFEESVRMNVVLERYRVPRRLVRLAGKEHNFDRDTSDPRVTDALDQVVIFLANWL
jgi:dipeptidyl aminopeptidase/acylaminoacyl peptidase